MAYTNQTWDKIVRQVALKANLLSADDVATLATAYSNTSLGNTQLSDRAIEFPILAVADSIVSALERIVYAISKNPVSYYRKFFIGTVAIAAATNTSSGYVLPTTSSGTDSPTNSILIGPITNVVNSASVLMKFKPLQQVLGVNNSNLTLSYAPAWYFTDNTRIWTTDGTSITFQSMVLQRSAIHTAIASGPMGNMTTANSAPIPEDLFPAIVDGAVAELFKSGFNIDQAQIYEQKFTSYLGSLIEGGESAVLQQTEAMK